VKRMMKPKMKKSKIKNEKNIIMHVKKLKIRNRRTCRRTRIIKFIVNIILFQKNHRHPTQNPNLFTRKENIRMSRMTQKMRKRKKMKKVITREKKKRTTKKQDPKDDDEEEDDELDKLLVLHKIQEVPPEEYFTFRRTTLGNGDVVFVSQFNESFRCDVCSRKTKKLKDSKDAHMDYCPQSKFFKGLVDNLGKRVRAKGYSSLDDYISEKYSGPFQQVVVSHKLALAGRRGRHETPTPTDPNDSTFTDGEEDKKLPAKIQKNILKENKKMSQIKILKKQNESKKLPVVAATAAAAASALLEADEDMDYLPPYQYNSDDGLGSYEGYVDPESPGRVDKASNSKKNIVARAGGVGGGKDSSSSSSSEPPISPGAANNDDWIPKGRLVLELVIWFGMKVRNCVLLPSHLSTFQAFTHSLSCSGCSVT